MSYNLIERVYTYSFHEVLSYTMRDGEWEFFNIASTNSLSDFILFPYEDCPLQSLGIPDTRLQSYIGGDDFIRQFITRYWDSDAFITYSEEITDTNEELNRFWRKFVMVFNSTYERYGVIIKAYNDAKTMMMDDVRSISESRFNDTPQNEGDFSSLGYTTTINQRISSNPNGTKMERLAELERGYSDVISEWVNEFMKIFIQS